MAPGGVASGNRLDGEVGWGLPVGSRFVGTPRVGFSASEYGKDYRVGYGLGVLNRESLNFELPGGDGPAGAHAVSSRRQGRLVGVAAVADERDARPSPRSPVSDPLLPGAAHAVLAPRHRAGARSLMAVRPPFHRHPLTMRARHPGRDDGPRRRVAHAPVPRRGVRRGVLHLRVLLPGTGVLRGSLPRAGATAPTTGRQRAASTQRGRPARSS